MSFATTKSLPTRMKRGDKKTRFCFAQHAQLKQIKIAVSDQVAHAG